MKLKQNKKIIKFFKKLYIVFLNFLILLFYKSFKYSISPFVSIFLPIYNKELYLKSTINNIQNQTLKNLEIIAINDFSNDNSLNILKKLKKIDKRIKIYNNDRNHGLLYSRAMGILNCTGEYVLNLDPDDMLSNKYNLQFLYRKAKKNNIDLIIYRIKLINNNNIYDFNKIILKLKLNKLVCNSSMKFRNDLITNKFIKRKIILKAYKLFKIKIYKDKWNYHEDNIWSMLINKFCKTKILLNKYIYIYLRNTQSLMNNRGNLVELRNIIYRFEMFKQLNKNKIFLIYNKLKLKEKKNILKLLKNLFI